MGSATEPTVLTILHFNDVYNIEPQDQEPVGGAARFKTAIQKRSHLNPMVLFSGDAFNPSIMSTVTKGKQMVPVLNAFGVHCAVYGNHDFDFGIDSLEEMAGKTEFPWLMSNVIDNETDAPLADGLTSKIIDWQGKKIGLMGLVEEEWIATLSTIDPEDITFIDYVEEGRALAKQLKQQGADYIIALTHMRWPNDERLAHQVDDIDLVLGGHDHDYSVKQVNGKYVIKSGTDFRQLSQITLTFNDNNNTVDVDIEEVSVTSDIEEDPDVKAIVTEYMNIMGEKMDTVIGQIDVELEGRFAKIRTEETNLGNFVTDIMLTATDADVALLNSGTLRSDRVHARGDFRVKDLLAILPMCDPVVVISLNGAQLLQALENGVSQYPKLEGRFPQVSGVSFAFDPDQPAGQRVHERFVQVQGEYLDKNRIYKLATKSYLSEGKDGYDVFKDCPIDVNDEEGPRLSTAVQNYFKSIQMLKGAVSTKCSHRQSIVALSRRRSLIRQVTSPAPRASPSLHGGAAKDLYNSSVFLSPASLHGSPSTPQTAAERRASFRQRRESVQTLEEEAAPASLAPRVEGRIIVLDDQKRRELEDARMSRDVKVMAIREESIETEAELT